MKWCMRRPGGLEGFLTGRRTALGLLLHKLAHATVTTTRHATRRLSLSRRGCCSLAAARSLLLASSAVQLSCISCLVRARACHVVSRRVTYVSHSHSSPSCVHHTSLGESADSRGNLQMMEGSPSCRCSCSSNGLPSLPQETYIPHTPQ